MFHCSTCEEGKTQLSITLQHPLVHVYVTLCYFFLKTGNWKSKRKGEQLGVAGSRTILVRAQLKMAARCYLSFVSFFFLSFIFLHDEDPQQLD